MSVRSRRERSGIDVRSMSLSQIDAAISELLTERMQRAVSEADPDTLIEVAMQEMFLANGNPRPPQVVAPGIVALAGSVRDVSSTKHLCRLFTVKVPADSEHWMWDEEAPTFIHSDSAKVGRNRWSVSLHQAIEGMVLIQHAREKVDDRHASQSMSAWTVEQQYDIDTGEVGDTTIKVMSEWTPTRLPPPVGEEDQRSYSARQATRQS